MDLVDSDLIAVEVTFTFDLYIKYYLGANDESHETTQASSSCTSESIICILCLIASTSYFVFEVL